jgi:hypothetical protein
MDKVHEMDCILIEDSVSPEFRNPLRFRQGMTSVVHYVNSSQRPQVSPLFCTTETRNRWIQAQGLADSNNRLLSYGNDLIKFISGVAERFLNQNILSLA